jgi:hypothetical protein
MLANWLLKKLEEDASSSLSAKAIKPLDGRKTKRWRSTAVVRSCAAFAYLTRRIYDQLTSPESFLTSTHSARGSVAVVARYACRAICF